MSASSPEELETLLEDAVLLGDETAVLSLFEAGAVLITGSGVTGPEQALAEFASLGYVAATRTVTGRREVAVIVGDHAVNVSCRSPDGSWRLLATIVRPGDFTRLEFDGLPEPGSGGTPEPLGRWR